MITNLAPNVMSEKELFGMSLQCEPSAEERGPVASPWLVRRSTKLWGSNKGGPSSLSSSSSSVGSKLQQIKGHSLLTRSASSVLLQTKREKKEKEEKEKE